MVEVNFVEKIETRPERIKRRVQSKTVFNGWFELEKLKMKSYRETLGQPTVIRRARMLEKMLQEMKIFIEPDELIVGSQDDCFDASYNLFAGGLENFTGYSLGFGDYSKLVGIPESQIAEVREFWMNEDYGVEMSQIFTEKDRWASEEAVWFTEPVTGHALADHGKVLNIGLNGIMEDVREKRSLVAGKEKRDFYDALLIACQAAIEFAHRFADLATEMARREEDARRKSELLHIGEVCRWVPANPARNFYEAVQSFWFSYVIQTIEQTPNPYAFSPGRLDQFLGPFLNKDLDKGRITWDEALELTQCLWLKFVVGKKYWAVSQNVILGGQTKDGRDATNEMTRLALETTAKMKTPQPSLSFRYHSGVPANVLKRVAEFLKLGFGMPALHGDDAVIKSLVRGGVALEDARDFGIAGCQEPVIQGCMNARTTATWFNLAKCLELSLDDGVSTMTGRQLGPRTGDPKGFKSFEDVMRAFKLQVEYFLDMMVSAHNKVDRVLAELRPVPFLSAIMNDCIEKGEDFRSTGARYNFSGCLVHGLANVADSLVAIKKLVFESGEIEMDELVEALRINFEGREDLRQKLINRAPKYGNDIDEVDLLAKQIATEVSDRIHIYKNALGGSFRAGFSTPSTHVLYGLRVGATPDGRHQKETLAFGIGPMQGRNRKGPTATMRSVTKFEHWRASHGLAFSQSLYPSDVEGEEGTKKLLSLIKTYFDLGGYYVYINIVNEKVLRDAQKHPESYRDLVVRVHGMSAFFVNLDPMIQEDIISRVANRL